MSKHRGRAPKVYKDDWKHDIKVAQNYICPVCGRRYPERGLTIHHKVPKCKKGTNSKENCIGWCTRCHQRYHKCHGTRVSDNYGNPIGEFKETSSKHIRSKSCKRRRGHRR